MTSRIDATASVDAILPAGGRIADDFAAEAGARIKALITLGGEALLERTLRTLRATARIRRIAVIGPDELAASPAARTADVLLPEGGTGPANILRGLEWLRQASSAPPAGRVLILTTDLPFLTPQAVTGFLNSCPPDLDVCVPLIRRAEFEARFPGLDSNYVRLRDGEWTMGCAFLVNPEAVARGQALIETAFAARKSQIRMVRLLGLWFILRFLTRRLTVRDIERRCRDLIGCSGAAILGCAPELAFDIDWPQDYRYAAKHLAA